MHLDATKSKIEHGKNVEEKKEEVSVVGSKYFTSQCLLA